MIKTFRHKGLERYFLTENRVGVRPDHAKKLRLILIRLHSAQTVQDMALPGLRLHPLQGQLKEFHAVEVNGNWRVVFRFVGKDVFDVDYLDYH